MAAALDLVWFEFAPVVNFDRADFAAEAAGTDPALSCAALDGCGKVVGAYLVGSVSRGGILDLPGVLRRGDIAFPERPVLALSGIGLVVRPPERGSGLGSLLRDHPAASAPTS